MNAIIDRIGHEAARLIGVTAIAAYALLVIAVFAAACLSGCGGAQQVSAAGACGSMYGLIAARSDYSATRSAADLDSQHSICERLTADPVTP